MTKLQQAAINALAAMLIENLKYNNEMDLFELSGDDLFTVAPLVAELAADGLGTNNISIQLPKATA